MWAWTWMGHTSRGRKYPSPQSFAPNSGCGIRGLSQTRFPSRREEVEEPTWRDRAYRGQRPRLQPAKSRDGGGLGWVGAAKQTCHSTKRTHRFAIENMNLSIWIAMSCAAEERRFSVGSFWKTNPPEGGILVGLGAEMPKNEDSFGCWPGARTLTLWVRVNGILEMLVTRRVTGVVGDASTSSA